MYDLDLQQFVFEGRAARRLTMPLRRDLPGISRLHDFWGTSLVSLLHGPFLPETPPDKGLHLRRHRLSILIGSVVSTLGLWFRREPR